MQTSKPKTRIEDSQRLVPLYVAVSLGVAIFGCLRMWWAWPNAPMLTNLDMLSDIDALLSHRFSEVRWLVLHRQHAVTGYAWYQYLSSIVFDLDVRWELVVYFLLTLTTTLGIGVWGLRQNEDANSRLTALFIFCLPLILLNIAGAGSRGMELGTYAGITLFFVLVLFVGDKATSKKFAVWSTIFIFLTVNLLLGGYIFGWIIALSLGCIVKYRHTPSMSAFLRTRIFGVFCATVVSGGVFYALYVFSDFRDVSAGSEFSAVARDATYPIKYLWLSFGSALIPSTIIDRFPVSAQLSIIWIFSSICAVVVIAAAILAARNGWAMVFVIVVYNPCLALTLMPLRDASAYQMLSSWYSAHGKLSLAMAVAVLVLLTPQHRLSARVSSVACIGVLCISVVAYCAQFQRGADERNYFGQIAISSLSPQLLSIDSGGQTQLRLGLAQSESAVRTMRKLKLGVHADPLDLRHLMRQVSNGLWIGGDYFDDGWLGKSAVVIIDGRKCPLARIEASTNSLLPSNFVNLTRYPNLPIGRLEVGSNSAAYDVERSPAWQILFLIPEATVRPSEISQSSDTRDLAAHLQFSCESLVSG